MAHLGQLPKHSLNCTIYGPQDVRSMQGVLTTSTDRIKRAARKEAWYADSYNPFRKNVRTPSTWTPSAREADVEAAVEGVPYLAEVLSSPSQGFNSQGTANRRQSTHPLGQEEKSQQRFLSRIFKALKHNIVDEDKKPKHQEFTIRNQLRATIFDHWVRALLILTPVGLAVHYAHLNATTDFLVNFFAVLPLTDMFGQGLVEFKMWSQDPRMEWIAYVIFGYEQGSPKLWKERGS